MKSILVTATTFPRWKNDTEPSFVYDLSKFLAKQGYSITVAVPHFAKARHQEIMEGMSVNRFKYFFSNAETLCYDGGIWPNLKKNRLNWLNNLLVLSA